jgi:hypothetical protein
MIDPLPLVVPLSAAPAAPDVATAAQAEVPAVTPTGALYTSDSSRSSERGRSPGTIDLIVNAWSPDGDLSLLLPGDVIHFEIAVSVVDDGSNAGLYSVVYDVIGDNSVLNGYQLNTMTKAESGWSDPSHLLRNVTYPMYDAVDSSVFPGYGGGWGFETAGLPTGGNVTTQPGSILGAGIAASPTWTADQNPSYPGLQPRVRLGVGQGTYTFPPDDPVVGGMTGGFGQILDNSGSGGPPAPGDGSWLFQRGVIDTTGWNSAEYCFDVSPAAGAVFDPTLDYSQDIGGGLAINVPSGQMVGDSFCFTVISCDDLTLGACCFEDGTCQAISCADCATLGGNFTLGGVCVPNTCMPFGACCMTATACAFVPEPTCTGAGGDFRGEGTQCPTQNVGTNEHRGLEVVHWTDPSLNCHDIVARAAGDCIPGPLIDAWMSATGAGHDICHQFGVSDCSPAIPADFFEFGSEPFAGSVCLAGVPLGPTPWGDFGNADTLILRSADPFDRCDPPSPTSWATVDIEVVALSLASIDPIVVTVWGAPTYWDVFVDLSPVRPSWGILGARKTHCNGGTYASYLNVQPRFTFTKVGDPSQVRVLDTGQQGLCPITLNQDTNPPWVADADPNLHLSSPYCTGFHPGIEDPNPTVNCPVPGDTEADGDVDLNDFATFATCFSGSAVTTPPASCPMRDFSLSDLDCDGDVDLNDFATLGTNFTG